MHPYWMGMVPRGKTVMNDAQMPRGAILCGFLAQWGRATWQYPKDFSLGELGSKGNYVVFGYGLPLLDGGGATWQHRDE